MERWSGEARRSDDKSGKRADALFVGGDDRFNEFGPSMNRDFVFFGYICIPRRIPKTHSG